MTHLLGRMFAFWGFPPRNTSTALGSNRQGCSHTLRSAIGHHVSVRFQTVGQSMKLHLVKLKAVTTYLFQSWLKWFNVKFAELQIAKVFNVVKRSAHWFNEHFYATIDQPIQLRLCRSLLFHKMKNLNLFSIETLRKKWLTKNQRRFLSLSILNDSYLAIMCVRVSGKKVWINVPSASSSFGSSWSCFIFRIRYWKLN